MPERQIRNRFTFVSGACLMLVTLMFTAGCGGGGASGKQAAEKNGVQEPQVTSAGAGGSNEPTRKVNDVYGETTVPAMPQRIVVLDTSALDNLLALGVKPVGAPYSVSVNANFFAYLASDTKGIENVGTVDQPNLESVAKMNPDLIIGSKTNHDAVRDKLKQIAPVYFVDKTGDMWKEAFRQYADAVNQNEKGKEVLAAYEKRVNAFKSASGDKMKSLKVSLLRPRQDHVAIYLKQSFGAALIEEAGLSRPAGQTKDAFSSKVTEEQIAELDGDLIIWYGRENELGYFQTKIQKNPLWNTLAAVKNKQVHQVDWEVWLSGAGIQAANKALDDLERIIAK